MAPRPITKLEALRRSRGLTSQELADAARTNRVYVSALENGRRSPSEEELRRLAKALRFKGDPAELLTEVKL